MASAGVKSLIAMWAIFPASSPPSRLAANALRGFTLLELLVVMLLLGLATALVAPAGLRSLQSWQRADERQAALGAITALPMACRRAGAGRTLAAGEHDASSLDGLPDGWRLELFEPLVLQANGVCFGATGTLAAEGVSLAITIKAPFCAVQANTP